MIPNGPTRCWAYRFGQLHPRRRRRRRRLRRRRQVPERGHPDLAEPLRPDCGQVGLARAGRARPGLRIARIARVARSLGPEAGPGLRARTARQILALSADRSEPEQSEALRGIPGFLSPRACRGFRLFGACSSNSSSPLLLLYREQQR